MGKVLCFGELLLRFSPDSERKWIHDGAMPVFIGGAELNVATALAKWDTPVKYCTALPENFLTEEICKELEEKKIDTSAFVFAGNRIGLYYLPQGKDLKDAGVIYDRKDSFFSELKPGMINWDKALEDCEWFHFSAITPALNENLAAVCKEGLEAATKKGVTISVDLNYRSKLWQYGKQPKEVMPGLVKYCHVVMGNIWAAENLLGIASSIKESKGRSQHELINAAGESMKHIHEVYPRVQTMAFTFRLDDSYFAVLQDGEEVAVSKDFQLKNILSRVGSGDCFMAGLIYGLCHDHMPQETVDFAAAAAVGKMQEEGDATKQTIESIKNFLTTKTHEIARK